MVKLSKLRKKSKKEEIVLYKNKEGDTMIVSPSFLYEVEVFSYSKKCFNIIDCSTVSSKVQLKTLETWEIKGDVRLKKEHTLIGANEKWLKENNYEKIE